MRTILASVALLLTADARAGAWSDGDGARAYGVDLVVVLGPTPTACRYGLAVNHSWIRHWSNFYADRVPGFRAPAPIGSVTATLGFAASHGYGSLTVNGGVMSPWKTANGLGGMISAAQVGVGLAMSSTGFAGPTLASELKLPYSHLRFDVERWRGAWHRPRASAGFAVDNACCGYLL